MPTFDIVSEIESSNLKNAVNNTNRDISTRFDFRGVEADVKLKEKENIEIKSESEFQCKQILDILKNNLDKQKIDRMALITKDQIRHSGKLYYMDCEIKTGIDQDLSKKINKIIKESKMKLQCTVQAEEVKVRGKKIDDLQQAIALLKESDIKQPLQFKNFRN